MRVARLPARPLSAVAILLLMGWPDSRPTVRENARQLGDLYTEFNFDQTPIPPLILDPWP